LTVLRFAKYPITAALLLVAAGCGFQQVQPKTPTGVPTVTVPTPTPTPTYSVQGGNVAADVNNVPIPMSLFKDFLHDTVYQQEAQGLTPTFSTDARSTLAQLVVYTVAIQQATSRGLRATPSAINAQFAKEIKSAGGRAKAEVSLRQVGLTDADVKYLIKFGILQTKLEKATTSLQNSGPVATARYILIAAKESLPSSQSLIYRPPVATADRCEHRILSDSQARSEAASLLGEIQRGSAFGAVAKRCSDDAGASGTATSGGRLNGGSKLYPYVDSLPAQVETAVFTDPVSQLQLVHTIYGWDIVQVTSRHQAKYPAALRTQIRANEFEAGLTQKAANAHIVILERVT